MPKMSSSLSVILTLALSGVVFAGCLSVGAPLAPSPSSGAPIAQGSGGRGPASAAQPALQMEEPGVLAPVEMTQSDAIIRLYERVSPAVVNITFTGRTIDALGRSSQQEGTGSGFIIDQQGHVVTNEHVVENASRLDVTLADGTTYVGQVIASDPATDLAILQLQAPPARLRQLTSVPLGDSSQLKVGQVVVAIGNPFGLERSASAGIVSSLGRSRPGIAERLISNMIQTDAAINPGNSGGPLFNLRGEVVGINEQIESSTRGNIGIGFAIPSNTLRRNLDTMLAGKEPQHAWIGLGGVPLTPTLAEQVKITATHGVVLATVVPNGPAARAGLKGAGRNDPATADIITEIDGRPVRTVEDIAAYVDDKNPNDRVQVSYLRAGQPQTTEVTLGVWRGTDATGR